MRLKVVSGGQSGVDRAALDAARSAGLPCGGSCPRGRWAEDGPIPARYPLVETDSADPSVRTERNVRDADATLILARGPLTGGTAPTRACAVRLGRALRVVDLAGAADVAATRAWLEAEDVRVLNVAGPRESGAPGIYDEARTFLGALLR